MKEVFIKLVGIMIDGKKHKPVKVRAYACNGKLKISVEEFFKQWQIN